MPPASPSAAPVPATRVRAPIGERETVIMMAMTMALQAYGIDVILPTLGQVATDLQVSGNDRQLVVGLYLLGAGLGALFPGPLADRYGRRPVLLASMAAYGVMALLAANVTSFTALCVLRLAQGFLGAGLFVLPSSIVRDRVGGDRMARMMSLIMMVFMIVPILAPTIGQGLMLLGDWRLVTASMALACALVAGWVWWRLPETLPADRRQPIDPRTIAGNMRAAVFRRDTFGYVVGSSVMFAGLYGFINQAQQLIGERFGAGANFPLWFGAMASFMAVANFANSRIVTRFGARRVSHTALLLFIGTAALQVVFAYNPNETIWQFMPLMTLNMALLGFVGANFGSIAMQPFQNIAGAASSAHSFLRMVTGSVLGLVVGSAYDGTARPLAWALLLGSVAGLALILWSERGKLFRRPNAPGKGARAEAERAPA